MSALQLLPCFPQVWDTIRLYQVCAVRFKIEPYANKPQAQYRRRASSQRQIVHHLTRLLPDHLHLGHPHHFHNHLQPIYRLQPPRLKQPPHRSMAAAAAAAAEVVVQKPPHPLLQRHLQRPAATTTRTIVFLALLK